MNRNQSEFDQSRQQYSGRGFQTHRSEKYRHPEQHHTNFQQHQGRFDDYESSARGGYGNEGHFGTYGNQGNEMGGSRNESNQDIYGTYSTSRNYGNMGSYGGAQGFGTSRGGYATQHRYEGDMESRFNSGMGSRYQDEGYNRGNRGYQSGEMQNRDFSNRNRDWNESREDRRNQWVSNRPSYQNPYGSETSGRFEGSRQGSYSSDQRGYDPYYSDRNSQRESGYYMGSSYNQVPRGDYGSTDGNYGSLRRSAEERENKPYGLSGYYSGGYGPQDM